MLLPCFPDISCAHLVGQELTCIFSSFRVRYRTSTSGGLLPQPWATIVAAWGMNKTGSPMEVSLRESAAMGNDCCGAARESNEVGQRISTIPKCCGMAVTESHAVISGWSCKHG